MGDLPITVLIAARDEKANIRKCVASAQPAERVIVLDSHSTDGTAEIAESEGVEVVQFTFEGGYPKKRQWALDTLDLTTPWVFLLDADEEMPAELWREIEEAISRPDMFEAFFVVKGFHFLGRKFRFGGFSFPAVLLFRTGKARFEELVNDPVDAFDMEVHERIHIDGRIGHLRTPLIHDDFKGLEAYIDRHNRYATWEAKLRHGYLSSRVYGIDSVRPRLFGNPQERRRFLKRVAVRTPFEPALWFLYHYVIRLGVLEGTRGFIACRFRSTYIAQVRAKMYELRLDDE